MSRLIIYGDLHGCLNEFQNLRKKLDIIASDTEVCVGDLITKGPYSVEILHYIQNNQWQKAHLLVKRMYLRYSTLSSPLFRLISMR
jgi:Icc-related predicted phosphoesterase